jgi:hypothetical protein
MNQEKKIEKILEMALSEELEDHLKLLKVMKRKLPFFGGTKRIAAALLKEHLGDVSRLDLNAENLLKRDENGKILFEDIKDGRARLFIKYRQESHASPPAISSARSSKSLRHRRKDNRKDRYPRHLFLF